MAKTYGPHDIVVLEGLEPVRRRPGMYVGDIDDGTGLHATLWMFVDEFVHMHCERVVRDIAVRVEGEVITVERDGPGLPEWRQPSTGKGSIEAIFTTLHAGMSHFHHHACAVLGGDGFAPVACALSSRLTVETANGGVCRTQSFAAGKPVSSEQVGGSLDEGLRVTFVPDPAIFARRVFDLDVIERRLHELARLNPLLRIRFNGRLLDGREGLGGWVRELVRERGATPATTVLEGWTTLDDAYVDFAFAWVRDDKCDVRLFANQSSVSRAPSERGFFWGLSDLCRAIELPHGLGRMTRAFRPGLVAIIAVQRVDAQFGAWRARLDGARFDELRDPNVASAVRRAMSDRLRRRLWPRCEVAKFWRERLEAPCAG